jgi:hypothetical protein
LAVSPLLAQERDVMAVPSVRDDQEATPVICRGRDDPEWCGTRWLTEFFGYFQLGSAVEPAISGYRLGTNLGAARSVGERSALGLSAYAMAHDGLSVGVQARYRRFLERGWVIDIGLGSPIAGEMNVPMTVPSLVGDVTVLYKDWFGLSARLETIRFQDFWHQGRPVDHYSETVVLFGGKVGRGPGLLASVLGALALGIAIAAFAAS